MKKFILFGVAVALSTIFVQMCRQKYQEKTLSDRLEREYLEIRYGC